MFRPVFLLVLCAAGIKAMADNMAAIPACCPPGWSLAMIGGGLFRAVQFDCKRLTGGEVGGGNIDDLELVSDTRSVYGHRIANGNRSAIPSCRRPALVRFSGAEDVELTPSSCLASMDGEFSAVSCPLRDSELMQRVGVMHKCCPLDYAYNARQRRCLAQNLLDHSSYGQSRLYPMALIDTQLECPKQRVLVEYRLRADEFAVDDGQLRLSAAGRRFGLSEYCTEAIVDDDAKQRRAADGIFLVRTCDDLAVCDRIACIRRCCADGEMFTKGNATSYCKKDKSDTAFHSFESLEISGNFSKPLVFGILRSLDCLKFRLDPDAYVDEAHTINYHDGSLHVMTSQKNYTNSEYCVEKIRNATWGDQKLYTFLCFDSKVVGNDKIRFKMYPIGLLISCSFYAITLLVYLCIARLRNLPGKILICLVCSLFSAYLGIALGQLMPTPNDDICFLSGFFVYFCLMAAFAWMNVMCFDIWQTFGTTKRNQGFKRSDTKRFLLYSLYGWGLPTLLTATTVSLTKTDVLSENIRPQFGRGRCWFAYDTLASANLLFFSGPVGILFLINFVLFSITLRYCNKIKREIFRMQSSNLEKPVMRRHFFMDKARFAMNTKLFVVMGITWLLELLSILFYDHKKTFFWAISDSFNVLLGVFVFFIFVFKKRIWHSILERCGLYSANNTRQAPHPTYATHSTYAQSTSMTRLKAIDGNAVMLTPTSAPRQLPPM